MKKRNVLTIRVPANLKQHLEKTAALQGVSINQLAVYAFTRQLSEIKAAGFFASYLEGKDKESVVAGFDAVMSKVKDRQVPKWDQLTTTGVRRGRRLTSG